MPKAKPLKQQTAAQKSLAFLRAHLVVVERVVRHKSTDVEADALELRREEPEVGRLLAAVGIVVPPGRGVTVGVLATAIREWERAHEQATGHTQKLTTFLKRARKLEELERMKQVIERRGEGPAQRLAYGPDVPRHSDVKTRVYALRDALSREQPEIERLLRQVGQSLGSWSLAGGVLGIVDFVADQVNRAVGSYGMWPLSGTPKKEPRMKDPKECARAVFLEFKESYDEYLGEDAHVTLSPPKEDDAAGLTSKEWRKGAALLQQKDLIKREAEDYWSLSDDGKEVCAHPEQLDRYLGPRLAVPIQHTQNTFNVQQMQNTQVGDHNTLNATYSTVLQQLAKDIEASDAPPNKKDEWVKTIYDIMTHPLTQTALTLTGTALLQAPR